MTCAQMRTAVITELRRGPASMSVLQYCLDRQGEWSIRVNLRLGRLLSEMCLAGELYRLGNRYSLRSANRSHHD